MTYLRDYQEECCEKVNSELSNGTTSTLVVMPTGTGKTETFLEIADRWPEGEVLVLAHREELVWQPWQRWLDKTGEHGEIEMGDIRRSTYAKCRITFASKDSLYREKRLERCFPDPKRVGLVIIDEAHHAVKQNKTYQRILDYLDHPGLRVLGVTATPDRTDELALGQNFQTVAFDYPLLDPAGGASAIRDGWLVPIRQLLVTVDEIDFDELKVSGGDFQAKSLALEMSQEKVLHRVAEPTMEMAGGQRCMVFAAGIDQASRLAEIFNRKMSGRAFCLVSRVSQSQNYGHVINSRDKNSRKRALKRFAEGFYQYAVNVGCLTEGYDCPQVRMLSMARPTKSRSLAAQMCGRGTRILPGVIEGTDWRLETPEKRKKAIEISPKPFVRVLDFVGNSRHKLVTVADVLGGKYPDEVVGKAKELIAGAGEFGVVEALAEAEEIHHTELEERRQIQAKVKYQSQAVDPFGVLQVVPAREPGWHKGRQPTHGQIRALLKFRIEKHKIEKMSFHQASQLIDGLIQRAEGKLATYRQCKMLQKHGVDTKDLSFSRAGDLISRLAANKWTHL